MKLKKQIILITLIFSLSCSTTSIDSNQNNLDPNSEMYKLVETNNSTRINLNERYNTIKKRNDAKKSKFEKEFLDRYKTNDFKTIYSNRPYTLIYLWEESWATCRAAKSSVRDLENKLNKNEIILYSMEISQTDIGRIYSNHFQNKIIPTTYLVNNKLDLIDKKNLTPDIWFEMDRNKNLIQLLLEN